MGTLKTRLESKLFNGLLAPIAWTARTPIARGAIPPLMRGIAWVVRRYRRAKPAELAGEALGREWQRLMPTPKMVPLTRVEGDTAYGEIRVRCPLRGTGDVGACHRMMAYDRALVAKAGGRFVVLRSQAEPGVRTCQVALRPLEQPHEDLVPAHERT